MSLFATPEHTNRQPRCARYWAGMLTVFLGIGGACSFDATGSAADPSADATPVPDDDDEQPVDTMKPDAAPVPDDEDEQPVDTMSPDCSANPDYAHPHNGILYRVHDEYEVTWKDAMEACRNDEAHLVVIDDENENAHVRSLITSGSIWIGLTDKDNEGIFVWVTGEPLVYTNWRAGEPDLSESQDYVKQEYSGQWNDRDSDSVNRYVCECSP